MGISTGSSPPSLRGPVVDNMRYFASAFVFTLLVLSVTTQQQRQLSQAQRRAIARKRAQAQTAQAQQGNLELITLDDGTKVRVKDDLTLSDVSDQNLNEFMARKAAVRLLVRCFEPKLWRQCNNRAARSLVSDVRKLGRGGVCGTNVCTNGQEKVKVERLVKRAIGIMQARHKTEWRQLIPNIAFLL